MDSDRVGAPTTVLNAGATGPTYIDPDVNPSQIIPPAKPTAPQVSALFGPTEVVAPPPPVMPSVQTYQPQQPAPKSYGTVMFLIGAFVVIIAVVVCVAAWKLGTQSAHSHNGPYGTSGRPIGPPPPHNPTNEGGGNTTGSNSLAYPGATLGLSGSQEGKSFYQYTTNDPFRKVREWYQEKLPNATITRPPGDRGIIMNDGKTVVIISGQEGQTMIMVSEQK